jgi:hypothetical protein
VALLIWFSTADSLAQQNTSLSAASEESLSEEVNDPTATLTQAQIQDFFTPSQFGTNAQPNRLQGRFILAVLPHRPFDLAQIVRPTFSLVTIPRDKSAATRTEFGDLQLLDLFVMPRAMTEGIDFRWAIGTLFCLSHCDFEVGRKWRMAGRPGGSIQVPSRSAPADFRADSAGNLIRLYLARSNSGGFVNLSTDA